MTSERAMYAVDLDTFEPKSLDQIQLEAKSCFAIKRERMKLERQSSKFGKVRPIFPELIDEIKVEFHQKAKEKYEREQANLDDLPAPFRKQMAQEAMTKLTGALASSSLINRSSRSRVLPSAEASSDNRDSAISPKNRPSTAPR